MIKVIARWLTIFYEDESGQAITEYGNLLAGAVASLIVVLGIAYLAQHGYINWISDDMCSRLREMASNAQTQ
jgi:Flp pilus assembly pilin Flp